MTTMVHSQEEEILFVKGTPPVKYGVGSRVFWKRNRASRIRGSQRVFIIKDSIIKI